MAHMGPDPKERRLGRSVPLSEWTDVEDRPFDGPERRALPKLRGVKWRAEVVSWWETVSAMPHCVLWAPSDWEFAVETAVMKQDWWSDFAAGSVHANKSTEIRRREDVMGVTREARRKLRIRYVGDADAAVDGPLEAEGRAAGVASLDERRRRLAGA